MTKKLTEDELKRLEAKTLKQSAFSQIDHEHLSKLISEVREYRALKVGLKELAEKIFAAIRRRQMSDDSRKMFKSIADSLWRMSL